MRHVAAILAALLLAGAGTALLVTNLHTPSMAVLAFAGGAYLLAIALAIPADAGQAIGVVAPAIQALLHHHDA